MTKKHTVTMPKKRRFRQHNEESSKKHKFFLLFICIYIILSFLLFDPKLATCGDNAVYIILAESIISSKGYRNIHLPEESPHISFPFGFPLLLSIFLLIFGTKIIALKFVVFLTGLCSFYFMYKIIEVLFEGKIPVVISFYLSVPIFIVYNHLILSEMPFLCLSLGSIYFYMKGRSDKGFFYYISFILAIYAFFVRTTGISLVAAILLFLVLKKQYKYFGIFFLIFLALFIPWYMRNSNACTEGGYLTSIFLKDPYQIELGSVRIPELLARIGENFMLYFYTALTITLLPIFARKGFLPVAIFGSLFVLSTLIGFVNKIKNISLIELYFVFATIILLSWHRVWSSERYLLSILPLLVIYIYAGFYQISRKVKKDYLVPVITGMLIFLNLLHVVPLVKNSLTNNIGYVKGDKLSGYEADWKAYFVIIASVNEKIPKDKIIMARKPEFVYLLTKNKSFTYPFSEDYNKMKDAISRSDYIIVDHFGWCNQAELYLLPVLQLEPENYLLIDRTDVPDFYLLKVRNK